MLGVRFKTTNVLWRVMARVMVRVEAETYRVTRWRLNDQQ
jgi:hypothetical protein